MMGSKELRYQQGESSRAMLHLKVKEVAKAN